MPKNKYEYHSSDLITLSPKRGKYRAKKEGDKASTLFSKKLQKNLSFTNMMQANKLGSATTDEEVRIS